MKFYIRVKNIKNYNPNVTFSKYVVILIFLVEVAVNQVCSQILSNFINKKIVLLLLDN